MGTETKFNCYTENTKRVDIPKLVKNSNTVSSLAAAAAAQHNNTTPTVTTTHNYRNGRSNNYHISNKQNNCAVINNGKNSHNGPVNDTSTVPFVPIYIDENNVIEGAKEILKVIRPNWDLHAVEFKKFTDGITNKLVGCFYTEARTASSLFVNGKNVNSEQTLSPPSTTTTTTTTTRTKTNGYELEQSFDDNNDSGNLSDTDDTHDTELQQQYTPPSGSTTNNVVLVRVYGNKTDLLIDRKAETLNIKLLHSYGFAPSLYATFKNGLAYDYVPGVTLNPNNVLRPEVWRLVACRMADMHRLVKKNIQQTDNNDDDIQPMLWTKTQKFFDLVPERFSDADKHRRLESTFLPITRMRTEFDMLYKRLEALGSPLVFSHNDLLLGNVVYTESQQSVNFIDYEYADYNFQAFDIGNHFAEFAGVDEVDYTRYPTREFQFEWLRVYLQTYLQRQHITDNEVNRLYVQVNQFALAAHFFWTIWSLIQAEHSTIDFDYVEYAFLRYNEYLAKKDEYLALDLDSFSS